MILGTGERLEGDWVDQSPFPELSFLVGYTSNELINKSMNKSFQTVIKSMGKMKHSLLESTEGKKMFQPLLYDDVVSVLSTGQ